MSADFEWGVFQEGEDRHVAPCTSDGVITRGHLLSLICPCVPTRDKAYASIIVHNESGDTTNIFRTH